MSDSLRSHELQHTRLPCPSWSPTVCSNPYALNQWYHPTISSSVAPFSYPQSFPALGSFPMSWLFTSGDQTSGASASVLPMNIQGWFSLGLTGLISFLSRGLSHPSTNQAWPCLASKIRRDRACSGWYGRRPIQGSLKYPPAPQFESINSSVFSLLYGPTLTSVYDYWKKHSFD